MPALRCTNLAEIRARIDALDRSIVQLLAERGEYVLQAASFKRNDEEVRAPERAAEVIANARRAAANAGANAELVARVYREIVAAFTDAELAAHRAE